MTGDVVVLEGPVTVTGQVNGSVIAADGVVRLAESARVGGDVFSSDSVFVAPGAKVGGESRSGVRFSFEGPLVALGKLLGPIAVSVSVLLAGLALLYLAPRAADAVAEAMASAPLASVAWGLLIVIAVPVAAVALVVSVLGLPLGLALLLSLGLWWLVGLTWAAWCAGRGLVRAPRGRVQGLPGRLGDPRGDRIGADPQRGALDARPAARALARCWWPRGGHGKGVAAAAAIVLGRGYARRRDEAGIA